MWSAFYKQRLELVGTEVHSNRKKEPYKEKLHPLSNVFKGLNKQISPLCIFRLKTPSNKCNDICNRVIVVKRSFRTDATDLRLLKKLFNKNI